MMMRNTCFDLKRNMTTVFGQKIMGEYAYDEELAGPGGMHIHVWVPEGTTRERLYEIYHHLESERDLVSMSYDYLPTEVKVKPEKTLPAGIAAIETIVKEKSLKVLKWPDGSTVAVDLFSASTLNAVFKALNEENKAKLERMISHSPVRLARVLDFCFSAVGGKK